MFYNAIIINAFKWLNQKYSELFFQQDYKREGFEQVTLFIYAIKICKSNLIYP